MQNPKPIKKLFNLRILLLIVTMLTLLLLALFPWKTAKYMEQQDANLLREQFSSRLKTQYHQVLRQSKNNNDNILLLAQAMKEKGMRQTSRDLLEQKINVATLTPQQSKQYDLILLHNYISAYHASYDLIRDTSILKFKVRKQLQQLEKHNQLTNSELQTLAEISADFGLLPLAVKHYYQLANNKGSYQSQWYAEAGRWANQSAHYASAANAFKLAGNSLPQNTIYNKYTNNWLIASIKANQREKIKPFLQKIKQQAPKSLKKIEAFANISHQAGFYDISSQLFHYLAQHDTVAQKQRWYEKASYWSAKAEHYDTAARYLVNAEEITNNANEKWVIKQRLIDIYIKGGKPKLALSILLPLLKTTPKNYTLSHKAIHLALSTKNIEFARYLNKNHLKNSKNSLNALNNQVKIEIEDEKYAQAIYYIKKIIKITPNSIKPRLQWAQLEAHEGNYQLALELWQWVYSMSNKSEHLEKVIQLAQLNIKKSGLKTLQKISLQQDLPKQAIYDVFFHLVNSDQKKSAEQFLSHYLDTHNSERDLLETLAKWYSGNKHYTKSLKTWNKIEKYFGKTRRTGLNKFELLWSLKHKRQAHQLWVENKKKWNKHVNSRQLSIMAEIAWHYQHKEAALYYYNRLTNEHYKHALKDRVLQYTRIAILNKKLGRERTALSAYRKGFIKTRRTELLIKGLQLSFDLNDRYNFERLTKLAKKHKRLFRSKSRYWLLQAAHAQQHEQYNTALKHYKTVLSLRPKSSEARSAVKAIKQHLSSI